MGYYINTNSKNESIGISFQDKLDSLTRDGAVQISTPDKFIPNLICIVDNGFFAAVGYAFSEKEMDEFKEHCGRKKVWMIYHNAIQSSGYNN